MKGKKTVLMIATLMLVASMLSTVIANGTPPPPPCTEPGLSPGFWKHNIAVALGENPGSFSSPHEGQPHLTEADLQQWADDIGVTLEEALETLNARGPGSSMIRHNMANLFNEAADFCPYVEC
jgi:hypothetical protein